MDGTATYYIPPPFGDEIASVVNCDSMGDEVAATAGKRHFKQETLCREILAGLIARSQVRAKVSMRKPDTSSDAVGVDMEARKR